MTWSAGAALSPDDEQCRSRHAPPRSCSRWPAREDPGCPGGRWRFNTCRLNYRVAPAPIAWTTPRGEPAAEVPPARWRSRRIGRDACHTAAVSTQARSGKGARVAPTLEEVAARAGVSRATASRVLRGASNVSEHARTSVQTTAAELSYTPNIAARSLVTGLSDSVAFYVDETEERMFSDPFFLNILRSVHAGLAAEGKQLIFTVASVTSDEQRFLHYAAGGHVDGVLLLSLHGRNNLPQELEAIGVPTVLSGRPLVDASKVYFVDADNTGGATMATEYLLDKGCRNVATVTGPLDMCAGQDRLAG